MIWIANKQDLSFYVNSQLCHCVTLGHASDMLLQGDWGVSAFSALNYTASVEVWTPDGNTALEVVNSSYYDIYFGKRPDNGRHFFTFRLKSYTAVMCTAKCFLIRIGISVTGSLPTQYVFTAWTEQYCIKSCCDVPRGITVNGTGIDYADTPDPSTTQERGNCDKPLFRLITKADCYSYHTGKYYGKPSVYSGTYIPYFDINVLEGILKRRPATVTRSSSFNCVLQQVESARQWHIDCYEVLPAWRMGDIEDCLHCNNIWVDDYNNYRKLEYTGGVAFENKDLKSECVDWFKFNPTFEECVLRQTYGCVADCDDNAAIATFFVVPGNYADGYFFNSNGQVIAQDIPQLLQWFNSNNMVAETVPSITCGATVVIEVSGNVIPPVIYYDTMDLQHQITAITADIADLCDLIPQTLCSSPEIGAITDEDMPCDAPSIGTITDEDMPSTTYEVYAAAPWVLISDVPPSGGELAGSTARLRILLNKTVVAEVASIWPVMNEVIANIEAPGWPATPQLITTGTDISGNIESGWQLTVYPDGQVRFTGSIVVLGENEVVIKLDNLYYSID